MLSDPDPYRSFCRARERVDPIDRKIGSIVIISTQPHTATAIVYTNRREIEVGDKVGP